MSINNNLDVSGTINSKNILPVLNNTFTLGNNLNVWKNAYINDLSVNNNLSINANLDISGTINSKSILPVLNNLTLTGLPIFITKLIQYLKQARIGEKT